MEVNFYKVFPLTTCLKFQIYFVSLQSYGKLLDRSWKERIIMDIEIKGKMKYITVYFIASRLFQTNKFHCFINKTFIFLSERNKRELIYLAFSEALMHAMWATM